MNANTCRFTYKYVQLPSVTDRGGMKVMKQGEVNCPDIPAHGVGTLTIPAAMKGANALLLTVTDKNGNDLLHGAINWKTLPDCNRFLPETSLLIKKLPMH